MCGFCTPGMLMAAKALLDKNPSPSRDEVVEAISGNICRCTGYEPIINADPRCGGRPTLMLEFRKDIFADERDDDLNEIGKPTQRQDMLGHVTGRTRYFDDHAFEGHAASEVPEKPAPSRTDPFDRHVGGGTRTRCAAASCALPMCR